MDHSPKEALVTHGVAAESKPESSVTATLRAVSGIVIPANRGGDQLGSSARDQARKLPRNSGLPLTEPTVAASASTLLQRTVLPPDKRDR
jgi:hypothetical protein